MKKNKETEEYDVLKNFNLENPIKLAKKEEFETKYQIMFEKENNNYTLKDDLTTIKKEIKTNLPILNLDTNSININEILRDIDLANLTPLKAFEIIVKLKEISNKKEENDSSL